MDEWAVLLKRRWQEVRDTCRGLPVVLVLGGCFSPPTLAHIEIMEAARAHMEGACGRTVVLGLLSPVPVGYPKAELAPAADRIRMAGLAAAQTSWLAVDPWESAQSDFPGGFVPTADVLDAVQLRAESALDTALDVRPVLGSDVLRTWSLPGLWPPAHVLRLVAHRGPVVVPRSDTASEDVRLLAGEMDVLRRHARNMAMVALPVEHAALSSTAVRRRVARGESLIGFVCEDAAQYIADHSLYLHG